MHLHVSYSSDENYAGFMRCSICSLLDNNKSVENITFHLLSNGISDDSKTLIDELITSYGRTVVFYEFSDIRKRLGDLKVESIALSAYSRLFLPEVLDKNIEQIIYLDCDSIVTGLLSELWEMQFDNCSVIGVEDVIPKSFKSKVGMTEKHKYINSGMIKLNLIKIRNSDYSSQVTHLIETHMGEFPHHDQGIINFIFKDSIKIIKPKYNVMTPFLLMNARELKELYQLQNYYSEEDIDDARSNPVFIHFTQSLITRPWVVNSTHPFKDKFEFYYERSVGELKPNIDSRSFNNKLVSTLFKLFPFKLFLTVVKLIRLKNG
ncbi:glycosyltransferase family 8 protein [Thalassotalea sp. Y01]|uniref:glycosyltransferase family 8 protein n=1 Tax=Thalassotalea sp. Y01 TaxID=2729613 RepID=UPI00145FB41C|nr:glycosyltransferase family 8 protein [Thalassotalea sp. Y01]NMP16514.1 glycosyltransferase family 8 protein [Thalassotalea sp. Y01]